MRHVKVMRRKHTMQNISVILEMGPRITAGLARLDLTPEWKRSSKLSKRRRWQTERRTGSQTCNGIFNYNGDIPGASCT